ncbi:hypothetical protein [Paenibacillus sp. P46E]|uniref:hypothetical protein n=1 Tax=Paenibacillus sp. P46E TaxID=1349436 RepID=UPI00093935C7|nr:hypothetical protein [Paenibacillus sp. P46E]OKQ00185.1 hypothetical protein A3849_00315 [Paenibacillus sp. P46E]
MHKRRKSYVLLLLSTFAVSTVPWMAGTTASVASAASNTATAATAATEISTLSKLSSIKLGTTLSVKLSDIGIFSQSGGNILTYTLTYSNSASSSVNMANYFSKVVTSGGSLIKGVAVSADASKKKIAAKENTSVTYYANVGTSTSVKGLKINLYGWNFSAANFEQRIGTFTVPAHYSLSALLGESKKVELGNIPVISKAESLQIYKYNGKVYAKVGISLTNLGTKVLTDPGYNLYLRSSGGSVFTLALDGSSSEYKLQPQEKKTLYYMAEIPSYMNLTSMTLQITKMDEALKLPLPVVSYTLPAAKTADFTVAAGYTRKVLVNSNIVDMQLLKSSVYAENDNGIWTYQFRVKNTGSKAVTLPVYELSVKSAEGYAFPITTTAFNSLTLKPLEEKLITLSASLPLTLAQDKLQLQLIAPASADNADKVILPVAYFKIPYILEGNTHVLSENGITNNYGTFGVTLQSLQRLPWGNEDLVLARLSIRNSTSKTITLPKLSGILKADQSDLTSSTQTFIDNDMTTLAPGASTQITLLAHVPYTLDYRQTKIILQETDGQDISQFLTLSTTDGAITSLAPLAAGEAYHIASTGKKASVKERMSTVYKGNAYKLIYTEVEMNSEESRQADLSRLYAQFRTADGQYFEATANQSALATSPAGKTLITFWTKVPSTVNTTGLQLYVGQGVAGGKLATAGTAAAGYVNVAAVPLNPADVTAQSNLLHIAMFPYSLSVSSTTGSMTAGSSNISVAVNYLLSQDISYQMGSYEHKLVLRFTDPFGQQFDKTLAVGTDLTVGSQGTYTTTFSSNLYQTLGGGTYSITLFDEFQGERIQLGSQSYSLEVTVKATATASATPTATAAPTATASATPTPTLSPSPTPGADGS